MVWITEEEYNNYHQRKQVIRRNYIKQLMREKCFTSGAISRGTGISHSVIRRFLLGGGIRFRTFDRIRLFCERYQKIKK